jgi:hypothetical protein
VNPASLAFLPLRSFSISLLLFVLFYSSRPVLLARAWNPVCGNRASAMPILRPAPFGRTPRKFTTLALPESDHPAMERKIFEVVALKFRGTATTAGVSSSDQRKTDAKICRAIGEVCYCGRP